MAAESVFQPLDILDKRVVQVIVPKVLDIRRLLALWARPLLSKPPSNAMPNQTQEKYEKMDQIEQN